jgi:prevent-host-death family protein
MESVSLTALRQRLFKLVDQVIETGVPVEIERHGHRLKIVLDDPPGKLARLRPHQAIVGGPEDLVEQETDGWQGEGNL